jgi:hypothetical protein
MAKPRKFDEEVRADFWRRLEAILSSEWLPASEPVGGSKKLPPIQNASF